MISFRDNTVRDLYFCIGGKEILRLCEDGRILREGREIESDADLVAGLRCLVYGVPIDDRIADPEAREVTDEQIKIMVERAEPEVHSMFDRRANNTRAIAERVIRAAIQKGGK